MLSGLLKSKYYKKCKSLLRMIKTRLEGLRKKKSSVVKFLKTVIADLLRNGPYINAYNRAQGLLAEQNIITCYNLMDQICDLVYNNVNTMAKQRDCPEDCKEPVQSLIYAAARISEIPEIRHLRKLFTKRYGNALEPYTNKRFSETFTPVSATKETKLELLKEIAAEFDLNWNSKSLENDIDEKQGCFKNKDDYDEENLKNGIEEGYNRPRSSSSSEDEMSSSCSSDFGGSSSVSVELYESIPKDFDDLAVRIAALKAGGVERRWKHVHPNLPNGFDDLAARLAALNKPVQTQQTSFMCCFWTRVL